MPVGVVLVVLFLERIAAGQRGGSPLCWRCEGGVCTHDERGGGRPGRTVCVVGHHGLCWCWWVRMSLVLVQLIDGRTTHFTPDTVF